MDSLFIHSSEVAACIGEHKYKKRWEAFQNVFERYKYGQEYKKAIERNRKLGISVTSKQERVQSILSNNTQLKDTVKDFLTKEVTTSDELKQSIDEFEDRLVTQEQVFKEKKQELKTQVVEKMKTQNELDMQISHLKKQRQRIDEEIMINESQSKNCDVLVESLQAVQTQIEALQKTKNQEESNLNQASVELQTVETTWTNFKETKKDMISQKQTEFGKQKEESLISSQVLGSISENNSKYYKKVLSTLPFVWGVGGKIDGLRDGELIEIKNRKSHIYDPLPNYDVIQLQCYMQILDLSKATLIQSLATENNTFVTKETVLHRDDAMWKDIIVPKLTEFVNTFYGFIHDPLLQDQFLQTPDNRKSVLLNSFMKSLTKKKNLKTDHATAKKSLVSESRPSKKQKTIILNVHRVAEQEGKKSNNTEAKINPDPLDAMDELMESTMSVKKRPEPPMEIMDKKVQTPFVPLACFFESPDMKLSPVDCSTPLHKLVPSTWSSKLESQFDLDYFKHLASFVDQDYKTFLVYPARTQLFTALEKCPFYQVKVVILGQDPYIHSGEAMGMSFSVPKGVKFPRSLKNIFEELKSDVGVNPTTGDLTCWATQGVLLLNTVLTVRDSKSDSHAGKGWEQFTTYIIRKLSEDRPHIVFLLWGGKAQTKKHLIDGSKHTILETSHPSPLSYTRGFQGCKHFSKTNEALSRHQQTPIDWNVRL